MLSWSFFLTSIPHNIPSKPLAAFPFNHYRNNGQSERGILWQKPSSILRENIGQARGSNQQPSVLKSNVSYRLSYNGLDDKTLDFSKMKAFAEDKINKVSKIEICSYKVENIVDKGENAGYQHFLLFFPTMFSKFFLIRGH